MNKLELELYKKLKQSYTLLIIVVGVAGFFAGWVVGW